MDTFLAAIGGFVVAAVGLGGLVVVAMRRVMILRREATLGFDQTVSTLAERAKEQGWSILEVMDVNSCASDHGECLTPRVKLLKLCKAPYALRVLSDQRHMACMMPCTIAVYEGDNGKVYISKMNTGLMGKLFGGTVAEVMGGAVSREEAEILEPVVKR